MTGIKNLTPADMRCYMAASCPSVHRLEDGRLLIVGEDATADVVHGNPRYAGASLNPEDEAAVIIHPDLLSTVMQEAIEKAVKAEFGHLTDDQALTGPYIIERLLGAAPVERTSEVEKSFKPDWKLSSVESLAVALTIALNKHISSWSGASDEELEAVAHDLIAYSASHGDGG